MNERLINLDAQSLEAKDTTESSRRMLAFVVIVAALGGSLFGYDTGIISSALLTIGDEFALGDLGKELVTGSLLVGGIIGALVSGGISDRFGRKRTVLGVAALFMLGSIVTSLSPDTTTLVATRFVLGLAVGAITQIMPVYIAELAPAVSRGRMVVLFQVMIAGGQLISYLIGFAIQGHWRWMFLLGIVPGLILFLGMLKLPESPRWLVINKRYSEASAILTLLRGKAGDVEQEVEEIREVTQQEKGSWSDLAAPWVRPALIATIGISVLCQFTGINAIIYYAPTILTQSGFGHSASLLATIGVGITLTVMTLVGSYLVDKVGRRLLMLIFLPPSIVSLVVLGAALMGDTSQALVQWTIVISIITYIAFNGGSLSVMIWLLNSELIPLSIRGKGAGLASVSMWVADLVVTLTTLSLITAIGASATFWMYAGISILALVFVYFCVPETKGRSLEDIERALREGTFSPLAQRKSK